MTNTPLNPDAVEAAAIAFYLSVRGTSRRAEDWEAVRGVYKQGYRNDAQAAVSAYLAVAQPEVLEDGYVCPSLEELVNSEDD